MIEMINIKENEELSVMNHSCAHLLAQAVKHLYPQAMFWVGPVIDSGFYYDIDLGGLVIKEEDLEKIEKEMKKISKDGKRIVRHEISKDEALEMFKNDPYKIDLINRMNEDENVISCYTQGDFTDLCRGPHVDTVKQLKYFKLLKEVYDELMLNFELQKHQKIARSGLSIIFSTFVCSVSLFSFTILLLSPIASPYHPRCFVGSKSIPKSTKLFSFILSKIPYKIKVLVINLLVCIWIIDTIT